MITAEKDLREHFDEMWIEHEMAKRALTYVKAREELKALKKNNKKEYRNQLDDYIDEVKGF